MNSTLQLFDASGIITKKYYYFLLVLNLIILQNYVRADGDIISESISDLTYIKQPGLANAASKIFSAERDFTISGFGEVNAINYPRGKVREGEIENYYTNLYRKGVYLGAKLTDSIIMMSELQVEYLHDGFKQNLFEANLELMVDFLIHPKFNLRFGNYPLPIGYVNVNEEPIAFYSVNRPETERLIIPSQWLETGMMIYGNISPHWEYSIGLTKGLDANDFVSSTWVRNGRYMSLDHPEGHAINTQIKYEKDDSLEFAVAGYQGVSESIQENTKPRTQLYSSYLQWSLNKYWQFFTLWTYGQLSHTDKIYSAQEQVIGEKVYGTYSEIRYFIQEPMQKLITKIPDHWKIPIYIRYERLNTHKEVHQSFKSLEFDQQDLTIWSLGINIRPRKNIVIKANFQQRKNHSPFAGQAYAQQIEAGFGFIY